MHQLLLLRHAKSSWDDHELPDFARPLNVRGQAAAAAMRGALHELKLCPDLVLVSTARRTRETAAALEPWPGTPEVEFTDNLYLAPASTMLSLIQEVAEAHASLMVVGHNPGLHELALLLAGDEAGSAPASANEHLRRLHEGYPSGALAEFSVPGSWASLRAGQARLERFICPRDLAAI